MQLKICFHIFQKKKNCVSEIKKFVLDTNGIKHTFWDNKWLAVSVQNRVRWPVEVGVHWVTPDTFFDYICVLWLLAHNSVTQTTWAGAMALLYDPQSQLSSCISILVIPFMPFINFVQFNPLPICQHINFYPGF